jgi:hypothetical protein
LFENRKCFGLERPSVRMLLLSWDSRDGVNGPLCLALNNSTPKVCKERSTSKTFGFRLHSTPKTQPPLAVEPGQPRILAWSTAIAVARPAACLAPSFLSSTPGRRRLPFYLSTTTHHSPPSFPRRRDVVHGDYSGAAFSTVPNCPPAAVLPLHCTRASLAGYRIFPPG